MKSIVKYFIGGAVGITFSFAAMFFMARHYSTTPVALINSNPRWEGWEQERYRFGMNKHKTPEPTHVHAPLISEGTVIMAGNPDLMRWGFHAFEAYAQDGKSRVTMLVNKHEEEQRPLAELYYYSTAYNHHDEAYNWLEIGSDVRAHSFMFSRDRAVSFGSHDFRSVIELAAISPSRDIDMSYDTVAEIDSVYEPDSRAYDNARCLLWLALKNARDGAMFYNKDTGRIVCKIKGKWANVVTEETHIRGL